MDIECPPLLPDYQAFMRGVDCSDQLIGLYNIGRRSKKWWKRVFSRILERVILNAYVLDSHIHPLKHALRGRRKRDYLSFRLQLAEELIGGFSRKRAGRRPSGEHLNMQRLTVDLGHWPEQSPKSLGCLVCKTKKSRHMNHALFVQYAKSTYVSMAAGTASRSTTLWWSTSISYVSHKSILLHQFCTDMYIHTYMYICTSTY